MKTALLRNALLISSLYVAGQLFAGSALARPAAPASGAATPLVCKDGSTWTQPGRRGACRGHGGIAKAAKASKASTGWMKRHAKGGSAAADTATGAAAGSQAPTAAARTAAPAPSPQREEAAPGGGNGQVWVNSQTKVYHCSGDRWYGKTKHGQYMSEADAKAQGDRPDHGKGCS